VTTVETRAIELAPDIAGNRIVGRAAVFNAKSHPMMCERGMFTEVIGKTAFNMSRGLGWPDVVCRLEHRDDPEYLLATTDSGLQLDIDDCSLNYAAPLIPSHNYVAEMVASRMITGSSFAFNVMGPDDDEWQLHNNGTLLRTIHSCRLVDVSPVRRGQYPQADVSVRALESFARFVGAEVDEVRKRALELGDLRGFLKVTTPKPGYKEPVGMKKRLEEIRGKSLALLDAEVDQATEEVETTEERIVTAGSDKPKTQWGRQALIRTMEARPNGPERLLETMAAQPVSGAERLAQTSVKGQLAALRSELASTRADIARLSDPAAIEREAAQRQTELAEARAQDELDRINGTLSPAAALRILEAARPAGVSPYVPPVPEAVDRVPLCLPADDEPEPAPAPQYRTMDPWVALRQLEAMRPPAFYVEAPVNRGRACDQYGAEQGGRL
jgi:uncharacterized protein